MNDDRHATDPEHRYAAEGLRTGELAATVILGWFPEAQVSRTRDAIQLDIGDDRGVVVLVTPEAIEVRLPTVEWTRGTYGPADSSVLWKRLRHRGRLTDRFRTAILSAIRLRLDQFKSCRFCGEPVSLEHRHGDDVCHGCAQNHLGIVH